MILSVHYSYFRSFVLSTVIDAYDTMYIVRITTVGLTPKEQGLHWVNILAADALAYSVARSSAVMALSLFYVEILTAYAIFVWINNTKCINIYISGFMQDY